ncbi:DExH-box ATP-dependent RNA helicase DExH5, mitochondrial-like isoform X1 [Chenopodium quinoa]|uniref:DExH-box ATP-dependent RNA helicase DExH5, mitochondrial-like isoform X1 n=1 Tax=Chenopodium quinoa TaxID=63459 RepID=UPI000B79AAF9|nr:DExH-box ATP-dependent RNA helicase DExH5, mitochondrial-like isoform X1 [Chenopodium quinoa]
MKDRPPSTVYVPPHQRLRSVITVPSPASPPNGSQSPVRSSSIDNHQTVNSSPNPNFDARICCNSQNQSGGIGHFQFNQQRNVSPSPNPKQQSKGFGNGNGNSNSFHYKFYSQPKSSNLFQYDRQVSDNQPSSVADEVSEEGSDREFGEFEPPSYSSGFQPASFADNVDQWKWKFNMLLRDKDKQELISRDKKDRRDFEQIASLANSMGLYSHSYIKVVVFSKIPLPNYRFDLDEKRPQREVVVDCNLQRRVDAFLADYLSHKSKSVNALQNNGFSRSSSSGSIAADEGLFEQPEPLNLSNVVMERIIRRRNLQLRDQQLAWQECSEGRKILEFRRSLPAFKERDALITAISSNQVIIVSGETGCGKTTQIPQFILESEIESSRGASCSIICTQPRRISAMSVAERVAAERGEKLGESVGYKVRLEGMKGRDTRLLFCTTGILLRRLLVDRTLKGITHVLVDEIHERGMNEDFLLIVLKELLSHRPELKLILMSATLDAELFSSYFGGAPVVHIPGFTYPVRTHFLEDILEMSGYRMTPYNQIDDYGPDRSWKMNKQGFRKRKSQIASVVEDALAAADFREYSTQTRESLACWNPDSMGFNLIENLLCNICENEGPGAVLVFMTGWDDISSLKDKLQAHPILGDPNKVLVLACHSSMASSEQRLIFEKPEDGVRKIVLATNIAETSITIDDVVYVVDCGKAKETSYDALNNTPCLLPSWIAKVSAQQRRGRAGRVQPGECYHLYPRCVYDAFAEYQFPEILRTPLQSLCLQIKSLKLGSISEFLSSALQSPELLAVQNAIEYLKVIRALDADENLTVLGRYLTMLPMEPKLGKMLVLGAIFNCLDPVLTIVAGLSVRDPFLTPMDKKDLAEAAKAQFSRDYSDHLALVRAYDGWKSAEKEYSGYDYCWKNFLSVQSMKAIDSLRKEFYTLLKDTGLVDDNPSSFNGWNHGDKLVRAVICYGLYPGICSVVHNEKSLSLKTMEDGQVHLYSNSVNAREAKIPYPWLVFNEKIKVNSVFLRDSTAVSDSVVLLFGGNIDKGEMDGHLKMLGGYLEFFMKPMMAETYLNLKRELEDFIQLKLQNPRMDTCAYQDLLFAIKLLVTEDKCDGRFVFCRQILKPAVTKSSISPMVPALSSRTQSGPGGDNSKSQLQTLVTRAGYTAPTYKVKQLSNNQFRATVEFNGMQIMGRPCNNKKSAEKDAASEALEWLMGGTQMGNEYVNHMSMLLKKSKRCHN